jgi:GT2 family glycosyltransferase
MVPFRDHLDLTLGCLESLERQEHDLDVRVLVIDNGSREAATIAGMERWLAQPRRSAFELVEDQGAFNYARIHNRAIAEHGGSRDLLLFLNNDVELIAPDCLQTLAMHVLTTPGCAFAGIRLNFPGGQEVQHGGIKIHETALTCGCYPFVHATEITDYVTEERAVFGVTFACAMVRREVYERLGGLDELLFPNSYGDVDIQARALEMGLHNFYFGTLVGTHHESKSRGRTAEELEFLALHERHAAVISHWKLRGFRLALATWPAERATAEVAEPVPPADPPAPEQGPAVAAPPLPLRYRLADRINGVLKHVPGPLHSQLRAGILGCRRFRWRYPAARPPALGRPHAVERSASCSHGQDRR